ncbi:hypothetical protein J4732_13525 [Serratia marcescens]|uniref:Uncharacterized protein n=1 Tax=Serratia marcescens TaxID=615 RepID=A0A939NM57_SERMA|nr:hypothetical protein [Serratia marcescens]
MAIINRGTAGGHDPALKVYDIVLGKYSVNLGAFKTPAKALGKAATRGSGSRWICWLPRAAPARTKAHSAVSFPPTPTCWRLRKALRAITDRQGRGRGDRLGRRVEQRAGPYSLFPRPLPDVGRRWRPPPPRRSPPNSRCRLSAFACCPTTSPTKASTIRKPGWHAGLCLSRW